MEYVFATKMFVFSFHPGHVNQLFAFPPHPSSFTCFKNHWRQLLLLNLSCAGVGDPWFLLVLKYVELNLGLISHATDKQRDNYLLYVFMA